LLQRAPKTNLHDACFTVAQCVAAADTDQILGCLRSKQHSLYLPYGPGEFSCNPIAGRVTGSGQIVVYLRAKTFLTPDQLTSRRVLLQKAPTIDRSMATLTLTLARSGRDFSSVLGLDKPKTESSKRLDQILDNIRGQLLTT
jgi:hypothetical protein